MKDIYNLRREFSLKSLNEADIKSDPIVFFEQWFDEAIKSEIIEPNAMILSTVSKNCQPSSRALLLKRISSEGFIFFTNYESKKALEIANNKHVALNFIWHELERQVRIEGIAEKISAEESDSYFEIRPAKSKLGAWASPQSQTIPNRKYLEKLMQTFEIQFIGTNIKRPNNWGGYIVKPTLIEFWQGRENRLHDRIQYTFGDGKWKVERLAP